MSITYSSVFCYRLLLNHGADKTILTDEGERPLDLVEPSDFATIRVMLGHIETNCNNQSDDETLSDHDATTNANEHK